MDNRCNGRRAESNSCFHDSVPCNLRLMISFLCLFGRQYAMPDRDDGTQLSSKVFWLVVVTHEVVRSSDR